MQVVEVGFPHCGRETIAMMPADPSLGSATPQFGRIRPVERCGCTNCSGG